MHKLNAALSRLSAFAPTILRVALGGLMAYHGFDKFRGGISGVEMFFDDVGVPAAALAVVLTGAVLFVKADIGIIATEGPMPGAELDVAILAGLVALLLLGPGRFAADAAIGIEQSPAAV